MIADDTNEDNKWTYSWKKNEFKYKGYLPSKGLNIIPKSPGA